MGSVILCVDMTGVTSRGSGMLALTATVGFDYIIVAVAVCAVRALGHKKTKEKQKYESLYSDEK